MENFTEDLLIEILSWLPVISLLRFRYVCKSWLALLENPSFIAKHHSNSPNSIILGRRIGDIDTFTSLSRETLDVITEDLGFQYFERGPGIALELLGCFNGIACLYDGWHTNIILWNPALRHIKILPKPSFVAPPNASCPVVPELGFGFDFKTNDFKLVMIHLLVTDIGNHDRLRSYKTEVYSLSTDSWKLIDTVIPDGLDFDMYRHPRTCVKGVYSKLMHRLDRASWLVHFSMVTFNTTDEVFIWTPMPQEVYTFGGQSLLYKALTELNGSVAYITYESEPSVRVKSFEISVLDEYGPNGTWTKMYTIGPLFDIMRPLGFWKNDELFFETNNHELVVCGPVTNELKKFNIQGVIFQLYEYKESLYSLNGGTLPSLLNSFFCEPE